MEMEYTGTNSTWRTSHTCITAVVGQQVGCELPNQRAVLHATLRTNLSVVAMEPGQERKVQTKFSSLRASDFVIWTNLRWLGS